MYETETKMKPRVATALSKVKAKTNRIIKIAAILCMVLFFFPLCTVSCSVYGETYTDNLSGWDCAVGTVLFDEEVEVDAHPMSFVILILPMLLFAITFIKSRNKNIAITLLSIFQVVALLIFRNSIIKYIEHESSGLAYTNFTFCYVLNIMSSIVAGVLGVLSWNTSLTMPVHIQRKCPYCGAALDADAVFCTSCGKETRTVAKRETVHYAEPKSSMISCTNCGAKVDSGARFCSVCGKNPLVTENHPSHSYAETPPSCVKTGGFHAPTDLD